VAVPGLTPRAQSDRPLSDATSNPIISGTTSSGKRIAVVYSDESDADLVIFRPVTAYPVPEYEGLIPMDPKRLSERTRQALAALPPEKRSRAEAAITRIQSPEYRETERQDREALDGEHRATGTIAATRIREADGEAFEGFIRSLRQARETAGLSLEEVASRSGIDKAQLSRLENGKVPDPRPSTLARYARAIGKRLAWSLEDLASRPPR